MEKFIARAKTLSKVSIDQHNTAFRRFQWPESIPEDDWWFSPDALTIAHSEVESNFTEDQKKHLAKWECINIFSLNNTGELELIQEVSRIMHEVELGEAREYLHHLIDEENQHMWYFNKFCNNYVGKVYPNKKFQLKKQEYSKDVDHFLVFARVLIFEEIGHYFNILNAKDARVNPFVREINEAHYQDEARHITYGHRTLEQLAEKALANESAKELIREELEKSIAINIGALYNPTAYRDSGIKQGMLLREKLLSDPGRINIHEQKMLRGVKRLLKRCGLNLMEEVL
ncbi:diiron oxygenase [Pleionea sediminis]|uniref:diiron oxygenase n=1 Tax=Pleionea sediminis TaxID=2569479 RepID=UPI001186A509|nr:diiron oxygenase [Pleionea sediminis]